MPELTLQCTPPSDPPSPPFTFPPGHQPGPPPFDWEDFAVFRETFLMYFTVPDTQAGLRSLGKTLYSMVLRASDNFPDWPESPTRTELRNMARDLRHAQASFSP